MNYFFILGNHPDLSAAELFSRLKIPTHKLVGSIMLAEITETINAQSLIRSLGGTIKLGKIVKKIAKNDMLSAGLEILQEAPKTSKFNFGISVYGLKMETLKLGLSLKTELKKDNVSCRFVTSRDATLSSVVVEQNKLVAGGRELVYIADGPDLWLGVTEAVQPFKELSFRDYGRPARDDHSGMLPPKLAQIMINLSRGQKSEILLDPFCGSGTILTEAMLMGYSEIAGSDISDKAIIDSRKNIDWVAKHNNLKPKIRLEKLDVKNLSRSFKENSIGAVVAETYLGPQRGNFDIKKVSAELSLLYTIALREILTVLKPGAYAVLAVPAFKGGQETIELKLPSSFIKKNSFLYGRAGQGVFRQILVMEKK